MTVSMRLAVGGVLASEDRLVFEQLHAHASTGKVLNQGAQVQLSRVRMSSRGI